MSIDLQNERIVGLTDAAKALPAINGKRPHASSIWRWCRKGIRGVRLDYARVGHRIVTSIEALNRFGQLLAEADPVLKSTTSDRILSPQSRTNKQRQRDIESAEAKLSEAGI